MAPNSHTYFDYYQSKSIEKEPFAIGGYLPLKKVFEFQPDDSLKENEKEFLIGIQAQLWSEYMKTSKDVEYMLFPRMLALSEVAWNYHSKQRQLFDEFLEKLKTVHFKRLDLLKVNYRNKLDE